MPFLEDLVAGVLVIVGLVAVADGGRWARLDQLAIDCMVELGPLAFTRPTVILRGLLGLGRSITTEKAALWYSHICNQELQGPMEGTEGRKK